MFNYFLTYVLCVFIRMIARGENEFELFQKMDKDIAKEDHDQWMTKKKSKRLMDVGELPNWCLMTDEQLLKALASKTDTVTAGRKRKVIDYSDHLSERAFLKAAEDGTLADILAARDAQVKKLSCLALPHPEINHFFFFF